MANEQNKFFRRWLFATKNLQFESLGLAFDSGWVHPCVDSMSGPDQNDQKVDFEYLPPNLMSNLGIHESPQKFNNQNFPNIPVHPEFNSRGIGWIRHLLTRARSWVLCVPRLSC